MQGIFSQITDAIPLKLHTLIGHISVNTNHIDLKLHSCLQECKTVKLDG